MTKLDGSEGSLYLTEIVLQLPASYILSSNSSLFDNSYKCGFNTALQHKVFYLIWYTEVGHVFNYYNKCSIQIIKFKATYLLKIATKNYYKLRQLYHKLRQWVTTNYGSFTTNFIRNLLQVTTIHYWQLLMLLEITANFIRNYGRCYKLRRYYRLRRNMCNQFHSICTWKDLPSTSICSFKYSMVLTWLWNSQGLIVENIKQSINFNTRCVINVSYLEFGSNFGTSVKLWKIVCSTCVSNELQWEFAKNS